MTCVGSQISAQALLKRTEDTQGKQRGAIRTSPCVNKCIQSNRYTYDVRCGSWSAINIRPGGKFRQ